MERDDVEPILNDSAPAVTHNGELASSSTLPTHPDVPASSHPPTAAPGRKESTNTATLNSLTLDQAHELLASRQEGDPALQILLKEYDSLKDKVGKLKSLLGRSAKAQREAKVDLDATQKRLDQALREIDRLNKKIDKLANRPTHMELLADFETNFDRALLSVGRHQTGGEDTAPPPNGVGILMDTPAQQAATVDGLLMQELADARQRIEKLEGLNSTLQNRAVHLEDVLQHRTRERDDLAQTLSRLELEKRMAELEADRAIKDVEKLSASCAEMQMEIDLLTKSSVTANARAAAGEVMVKAVKTDLKHVQELEAKVQAFQEWALASSEAKSLAQERVRFLENQLRSLQRGDDKKSGEAAERILMSKSGSFVIGAGDVGARVFSLTPDQVKSVLLSERVVLRWRFDLTSETCDISFGIMRGACDTPAKRRSADYIIKNRLVKGGAAGETDNAFTVERSCTIEWSNTNAWIRPKTIKYDVEAVVLPDE